MAGTRAALLPLCALVLGAGPLAAQDLRDRPPAPPAADAPAPAPDDIVDFSADALDYAFDDDIVTARGDVRMTRQGSRLRANSVTWNRRTGQVVADGNIAVVNPAGDVAYGDRIELTDTLRDGVIENMLVVMDDGGRIAARRGTRDGGGAITVQDAAYTGCSVVDTAGCPKEPSWKITARTVVYDPAVRRIRYTGARITLFGRVSLRLPSFSHPVGDGHAGGLLAPIIRLSRVNGLELGLPYLFDLGPNRDLTITPRVFTAALPMLQVGYRELNSLGAFSVDAYGTYSRRSDDLGVTAARSDMPRDFRGFVDGVGRYQLTPNWSVDGAVRFASDRTFLRRYDISREDRLRSTARVQRIDTDSYLSIAGWAVQSLRLTDEAGIQPLALPIIDYRRRFDDGLAGGRFELQLNSLALHRDGGQDTQRAFAGLRWDLRRLTRWGQEVTFTAYGRGDLYNTSNTLTTIVPSYRGVEGFQARAIGAVAVDVRWPLAGAAFGGGVQRIVPRVQLVAAPRLANLAVPNEDARAVDLEDSNLFALNRFAGYDRFEDSSRITYGLDYALDLPGLSVDATLGQSWRVSQRPSIFPDGTGLSDRFSDFVGRTSVRYRDLAAVVHRYRLDKDSLAVRRNEIDATIGSADTYVLLGYLRLNRDIVSVEDLLDREEARVGGRVAFATFWSVFGSATIDLTDRKEDPAALSDGFEPIRSRLGVAYEDDCLRLGLTWRRDYETTGDARRGNSYLLTLSFKNLGR